MINVKPLLVQAHIDILNLVDSVIDDFAALDVERHSQAPAAMGLLTLWDEFKEQVQNGESVFFVAYEATMCPFAAKRVEELLENCDEFRLTALWVTIFEGGDFLRDEHSTCDRLQAALEYSTYERISQRAATEAIEYRPDAPDFARKPVGTEKAEDDAPQNVGGQMTLFG